MTAAAGRPETLARLVARRIVGFAVVAMLAQAAWMLWRYVGDPDHIADHLLALEIDVLSKGVSVRGGEVTFELPSSVADRYRDPAGGYVARLRSDDGSLIWGSCDPACLSRAFAFDTPLASTWLKRVGEGYPLSVLGGRVVTTERGPVYLEIAIEGDRQNVATSVIAEELAEEMLLPTGVALALAIGAALYTISRSLAPVEAAAERAVAIDPLKANTRIDPGGMPLEIVRFVTAVNLSYGRVRELMTAQKLFTAAISHEIRTPLAAIRLELENVDDPRARRAIDELDELVAFVEQLTALARIEAAERPVTAPVDLTTALRDVVATVAPWVYDQGASIELAESGGTEVAGDERLIKNAARNLVENAVRHGGKGVAVTVRAGPGAVFSIEDDGREGPSGEERAAPVHARPEGGLGVGLEIVRRIAALHDAAFEIGERRPRGVVASLRFPDALGATPSPRS